MSVVVRLRCQWRVAVSAVVIALVAAGCDEPRKAIRGPSSEPVDRVEASLMALVAGAAPSATPLVPGAVGAGLEQQRSSGEMPTATQLLSAFRSALPAGTLAELVPALDSEEALALVVQLNLTQYRPVLLAKQGSTDGVQMLTDAGAQVVLGSPFVAEFSPLQPLGLLQLDGRVLNELQPHGYTRVLGFRANGIGVVGRGEFHRGLFDSAIQVGPGIIEQGKLDISERELKLPAYFRTFVVNCGTQVLAGASTRPVHLRTLGAALLAFADAQGLACDEAVNLSGDREVLLATRNDAQAVVFGNPRVKKTALIGFVRRSAL